MFAQCLRLCKIHEGILPDSRNKKCYHLQDALCLLIVAVVFEIYELIISKKSSVYKGLRGGIFNDQVLMYTKIR